MQLQVKLFCILMGLVILTCQWMPDASLSSLLASTLPANLSHFTLSNSYTQNTIIIFGGVSNGIGSNRTFMFNLTSMTSQQIVTSSGPTARINSCSILFQNVFYMFSGQVVENGTTIPSKQFWKLDLVTKQWQIIQTGFIPQASCQLYVTNQNTIMMAGQCQIQTLNLFIYNPATGVVAIPTLEVYGQAQIETKLWDGTLINNTLPIEQAPNNATKLLIQNNLPVSNTSHFHISDSQNSTTKQLQANNNIYSLTYGANDIVVVRFIAAKETYNTHSNLHTRSVNWNSWNVYGTLTANKMFYLDFINQTNNYQQRVTTSSINFYSNQWPDFASAGADTFDLKLVSDGVNRSSILIIVHGSLKAYYLHQNVYSYGNVSNAPQGLNSTFFGVNQCQGGWRLPHCNQTTCPNSLTINSAEGMRAIQFQCSGHGICINGSCQCDSLWEGSDCSIYKRRSCLGTKMSNFPLINCECMDATLGGNDCSVRFCPSGCSGHGVCSNGVCSCDASYYGADCSIMIADFKM